MELTNEEKQKVIEYLPLVKNRINPDTLALNYLSDLFVQHVDKNFKLSCGRCKRNLCSFWASQITTWK